MLPKQGPSSIQSLTCEVVVLNLVATCSPRGHSLFSELWAESSETSAPSPPSISHTSHRRVDSSTLRGYMKFSKNTLVLVFNQGACDQHFLHFVNQGPVSPRAVQGCQCFDNHTDLCSHCPQAENRVLPRGSPSGAVPTVLSPLSVGSAPVLGSQCSCS